MNDIDLFNKKVQQKINLAWPEPQNRPEGQEKSAYIDRICKLLKQKNAVLVAHYYVDHDLQELAEKSGGCVADSLEMARFGSKSDADILVVAGVRFMGETAKILSPEKKVLMPTLKAECSLDLSCPADDFAKFCEENSDREVVVYANTSCAVKALADWVVTSSIAVKVVDHLEAQGKKIIWAPDRYLGQYIQKQTSADMLIWQGSCIVHEEFKFQALLQLKQQNPDAAILVHPESPQEVIALADFVGSTSQLINAAKILPQNKIIVATEQGIFYKMQQAAPNKTLLIAPTGGQGATCRSCAHCPWMGMNTLINLEQVLINENQTIELDAQLMERAKKPLTRMLNFKV